MKRVRTKRSVLSPRAKRIIVICLASTVGLFVLANLILWSIYRNRTYPNTQVLGANVGNTLYDKLSEKITDLKLLPEAVEFTYEERSVRVTLEELGIYQQVARTTASANQQRSWLPVLNLLASPRLKAPIGVDGKTFEAKAKQLSEQFYKQPQNARLVLQDATVTIAAEQSGYSLDQKVLQEKILEKLDQDVASIPPPVKVAQAEVKAADLTDDKQTLEQQLNTVVTYRYESKTKQTTTTDIAKWFAVSGEEYVIVPENVRAFITQVGNSFGIRVKDISQAISSSTEAVTNRKPAEITLTRQASSKTYLYCTALKGVDNSYLPGLKSKLQSAYSHNAGWSLGGLVEFREVDSGCNFTVWLSAASLMPSFGAICDPQWSCRVGSNVVINADRWLNASNAWNANGGALEEYRNMVINHETGHWLGFGHSNCPGPGLAAPVMQQQSINLQGCSFNAWPTASEQASLRNKLGI